MPKNLLWSAATGILAIVGTLVVTALFQSSVDGSEALEAQRITAIVERAIDEKMQVEINGETLTYGQALSKIHTEQVATTAALKILNDG